MGVLRWPPSEFWQATPIDLTVAMLGYFESRGVNVDEATAAPKISNDDLRKMLQDEPLHSPSIKKRGKGSNDGDGS